MNLVAPSSQQPVAVKDQPEPKLAADRKPTPPLTRARPGRRWLVALPSVAALAVAFQASAAPGFELTDSGLPGVARGSVACGDFNGDGSADVLLTGADHTFDGISQVWQNQSGGLFTNLNAGLPGVSSSAVARGDFDNDGRLDLLLTGFVGVDPNNFPIYLSQVWRNTGDGGFALAPSSLPAVDAGAVALADYDADGNLDILLTGYSATGAVAQVWRNRGDATFTNIHAGLPGLLYSAVAWGDADQDGLPDILLTGTPDGFGTTATAQLWRNRGNGTFAAFKTNFPGVAQGAVAWGDLDQDGRLDLLLTGYARTNAICQLWRNLGGGVFTQIPTDLPGVYRSAVALGDYDHDGKLDIALAGMGNQTDPICQLWRNAGNWVFTNVNAGFPGSYSSSIAWADFNNDSRLDLLVTGLRNGGTRELNLYLNTSAAGSDPTPRIRRLTSLPTGARHLTFDGQAGFGYTVLASTNCVQWTALGAANDAGPGTFQFSDLPAANLPSRFYRLRSP